MTPDRLPHDIVESSVIIGLVEGVKKTYKAWKTKNMLQLV